MSRLLCLLANNIHIMHDLLHKTSLAYLANIIYRVDVLKIFQGMHTEIKNNNIGSVIESLISSCHFLCFRNQSTPANPANIVVYYKWQELKYTN